MPPQALPSLGDDAEAMNLRRRAREKDHRQLVREITKVLKDQHDAAAEVGRTLASLGFFDRDGKHALPASRQVAGLQARNAAAIATRTARLEAEKTTRTRSLATKSFCVTSRCPSSWKKSCIS